MMTNLTKGNLNERKFTSGVAKKIPNIPPEEMRDWLLAIPPLQVAPNKPGKQRFARALVLDPSYQVS